MNEQERELLKAELKEEVRREVMAEFFDRKPKRKTSTFSSRVRELIANEVPLDSFARYALSTALNTIARFAYGVNNVMNLSPKDEDDAFEMASRILMELKEKRRARLGDERND